MVWINALKRRFATKYNLVELIFGVTVSLRYICGMKCLQEECNNEFESKTGRRKFCSDSCKMKYFRKHGKKVIVTPMQMQVLYNSLLEMVGKINYGVVPTMVNYDEFEKKAPIGNPVKPTMGQPFTARVSTEKTFDQFKEAKRECENEEDWEKIKAEIENSTLTTKQKNLLINYA